MEAWISYVVAVPLYGGAIVPTSVAFAFRSKRFRRRVTSPQRVTLLSLCVLQVLAFFPFLYYSYRNNPDAFFALWLPALTGLLGLLISITVIFAGLMQKIKQDEQVGGGGAEEFVLLNLSFTPACRSFGVWQRNSQDFANRKNTKKENKSEMAIEEAAQFILEVDTGAPFL